MKKFKFLSIFLCLVVLISIVPVNASTRSNSLNGYLLDNGHGEFVVQLENGVNSDLKAPNQNSLQSDDFSIDGIKKIHNNIYQIISESIKNKDKEYDKLMQVKSDTFLRVKEVQLDLLDSILVEKVLTNYDVNSEMAKSIRSLSLRAISKDPSVPKNITIYTPKKEVKNYDKTTFDSKKKQLLSKRNSTVNYAAWEGQFTPYYYTGYLGEQYLDEVWYGSHNSGMQYVKQGTVVKSYVKTVISNIGEYGFSSIMGTLTGGVYDIASLFFPNISDFTPYPTNQDDLWQASLVESKYRKFTSIRLWDGYAYNYKVKAIGGNSYMHFDHYVYIKSLSPSTQNKSDPQACLYSPNYFELDKMAYNHRNDFYSVYDEDFTFFSPNNYTRYASLR